jgi:hypothetical protein
MVTLAVAREVIYQKWVDDWGATSLFTFDNEKYNPPSGSAWARVGVRHRGSALESIGGAGNNNYQRTGVLFVQVFTPIDQGVSEADSLSQAARAIFEGITLSNNAIRFNNAVIREVGSDGSWYQVNVECEFQYDERK